MSCVYVWFHSGRQHGFRHSMDAVSCALNISTAFTESVPHKCTARIQNGPENFWNTCVSICLN